LRLVTKTLRRSPPRLRKRRARRLRRARRSLRWSKRSSLVMRLEVLGYLPEMSPGFAGSGEDIAAPFST
jgi:hypothetical protein